MLREWPFHSESVFFKIGGGSQVSELRRSKSTRTSDFQSEVGEVFGEIGGELGDFRASVAGPKYTLGSEFTIAVSLLSHSDLCGHHLPESWELQPFFLSKKGSQRSKSGGHSKNTTA